MWSPRYFSRLWCTLELAAWVHLSGDAPVVLPVHFAAVLLLHTAYIGFLAIGGAYSLLVPGDIHLQPAKVVLGWLGVALMVPEMYLAGQLVRDLKALPEQLRDFSIRHTKCFCCTHDHVHPETGQVIPCDRELVLQTVRDWFSDESHEDALDLLDGHVRKHMAPAFTAAMEGTGAMYTVSVCTSAVFFWCWASAWFFGAVEALGDVYGGLRLLVAVFQYTFLTLPACFRLMLKIASLWDSCVYLPRSIKVLLRSILYLLCMLASDVLFYEVLSFESLLPQVFYVLGSGIVTLCLFTSPQEGWGYICGHIPDQAVVREARRYGAPHVGTV